MSATYVEIAVNIPQVSGVFDYHLPPELEGLVSPGCLVEVPFGPRAAQGVVVRMVETPQVAETRPVKALLDPQPVLTPAQMTLGAWLAERTLTPLAACLHRMLPVGLSQQADTLYQLSAGPQPDNRSISPLQERLLTLLRQRGGLRGRQIDAAIPHQNWKAAARGLVQRGWLAAQPVLPPPAVRPKVVRTVQLAVPPGEIDAPLLQDLGRGEAGARREKILRFLQQEPMPVNVSWAYAASGGNLQDLVRLADRDLVILSESEVWRDPLEDLDFVPVEAPPLTPAQAKVWEDVEDGIRAAARGKPVPPFLLHGVTGSGKTEIYLQAVAETLRLGRQAIVLVPEIALTPQTVRRFITRFPGQVGLMHSRLSPGERYDTWRRARAGRLPVIIGPRSALFAPLPNLGLVVVDECHDQSYYQAETVPHYHAVSTAMAYARQTGGVALLGTATPDVSLLYQFQHKHWHVVQLPVRILAHRQSVESQMKRLGKPLPELAVEGVTATLPLPPVNLVDMRQELKAGNRSIFSRALQEGLRQVLEANQQAILFLNRRGSATYVFCRDCGYTLRCPRCEMPLTYHRSGEVLLCHTCGYRRKLPKTCPECGSTRVARYGTGTEKVETEVKKLFPAAEVLRWDASTTSKKGAHEIILSHFINHRADILIGTQMLAKGLDLPLVTLVGVVLADVGLSFPDFRAAERTFQLLTQVSGRAGRSPLGGRVILQTFQPDHYAIRAASLHDFYGFYHQELNYRRQLEYPPFYRLVRLEYRDLDARKAEQESRRMAADIQRWIEEGEFTATGMIGPVPCFFHRLRGYYRWQIVLRGPNPAALLQDKPLGDWRVEVDPPGLL